MMDSDLCKRDIDKTLFQLRKNIRRTEDLMHEADKVIKKLKESLSEFESEISENSVDQLSDSSNCAETEYLRRKSISREEQKKLKLEDRIVWIINDDDPQLGTVKWIGMMHDGLVAGVEFDEAIGNSDGNLDGQKLFRCQLGHGRFVLVRELILWTDFAT